jgi:hypothetical protein
MARAQWLIERARKARLARLEAEKLNPSPKPPRKTRAESEWENRVIGRRVFGAGLYAEYQARNAVRDGKASPLPSATRPAVAPTGTTPDGPDGPPE